MKKLGTSGHGLIGSRKAQMGIVFFVLILLGLIFFGVVAQWNKMALSRTQATMASNLGVAALTSQVASYGEAIILKKLDGERIKCEWTGAWLLKLLIAFYNDPIPALLGYSENALLMRAAAPVSATSVQGASVPAAVPVLWSILFHEKIVKEDRFIEAGIQAALPLAVSDPVKMKDEHDFNMNGAGGDNDVVSRPVYLETMRVWNLIPPEDPTSEKSCQPFEDLQKALYNKETDTGLMKDLGFEWTTPDTKCGTPAGNPCCTPLEYRPQVGFGCKKDPEQESDAGCNPPLVPDETWSYDDGYCSTIRNPDNLFAFIGVDDGNKEYKMNSPNTLGSTQSLMTGDYKGYWGWDSTGSPEGSDNVFPLLWKLHDSVIDIMNDEKVSAGDEVVTTHLKEDAPGCHWVDMPEIGKPSCKIAPSEGGHLFNDKAGNLFDRATLTGCGKNRGWKMMCAVSHPSKKDVLDLVRTVEPYFEDYEQCPEKVSSLYGLTTDELLNCKSKIEGNKKLMDLKVVWRPGWNGDSKDWPPYSDASQIDTDAKCINHEIDDDKPPFDAPNDHDQMVCNPVVDGQVLKDQCGCTELHKKDNPKGWSSDDFDDMFVRLRKMVREMTGVLDMDCKSMDEQGTWARAVQWVTYLKKMSCDLRAWREIYKQWVEAEDYHKRKSSAKINAKYTQTWCFPEEDPADMPDSEKDEIASAGIRGTIDSVKACLEYNETKQYRFGECQGNCEAVQPDPSECHIDEDGNERNFCGVCSWHSRVIGKKCRNICIPRRRGGWRQITKCEELSGQVYDAKEGGCFSEDEAEYDLHYGETPALCWDLPRSFYAHQKDMDGMTMEAHFKADSCCNTMYDAEKDHDVRPFVNRRFKHEPSGDVKPDYGKCNKWLKEVPLPTGPLNCPETGPWKEPADKPHFCQMCDRMYIRNENDSSNLNDPAGNPLKVYQDTLVRVTNMFQAMTINRMKQRRQYLTTAQEKVTAALDSFDAMAEKIDAVLPAFETTVEKLCNKLNTEGEPTTVYYVWKNPGGAQAGANPSWHAAKIVVAIPGRCKGQNCFTNHIPWDRPYFETYYWKACRVLWNSRGVVRINVSRWDEERDPISVIQGVTRSPNPHKASLDSACGNNSTEDKDLAYISCENCKSFPGRMAKNQNSECLSAVESLFQESVPSVTSEGEYWVTKDPDRPKKIKYNLKIRQK